MKTTEIDLSPVFIMVGNAFGGSYWLPKTRPKWEVRIVRAAGSIAGWFRPARTFVLSRGALFVGDRGVTLEETTTVIQGGIQTRRWVSNSAFEPYWRALGLPPAAEFVRCETRLVPAPKGCAVKDQNGFEYRAVPQWVRTEEFQAMLKRLLIGNSWIELVEGYGSFDDMGWVFTRADVEEWKQFLRQLLEESATPA